MSFRIRIAEPADRDEWLRMRSTLFPEVENGVHLREIDEYLLAGPWGALRAFVAERIGGGLAGFVEASIRPYAEGCETRPVGYLECWFVDPDMRRRGISRRLIAEAEAWSLQQGCEEMASDTRIDNELSQQVHAVLGYEEISRVVHLRKRLQKKE